MVEIAKMGSKIAGLPVVEAGWCVKRGPFAGVPIAREVALATGLVSLVLMGGYAYFLLNKDVLEVAGDPSVA